MNGTRPPAGDPIAVHRALLAVAREREADFNAILIQYAIERFIDRLARSRESQAYVLKGAMLFRVWTGNLHRPTKDVDLLGHGDPSPESVASSVRTVAATDSDDGLRFDPASVRTNEIRERQAYEGVRVTLSAYLAHVPITVRIDVGFGDAVTPPATTHPFPTLLGHDPPMVRAYPPETAVAEKLEAMCTLGLINSRMKDYYDVLTISRQFEVDGTTLAAAIRATFERRATTVPSEVPTGLAEAFGSDAGKQEQWSAFRSRMRIEDAPEALTDVVASAREFMLPALTAAGGPAAALGRWVPGDGWTPASDARPDRTS